MRHFTLVVLTLAGIGSGTLLVVSFIARYPETPGWGSKRGLRTFIGAHDESSWCTMDVSRGRLYVEYNRRVDPGHERLTGRFSLPGFHVSRHTSLEPLEALLLGRQILRLTVLLPLWLVFPLLSAYPTLAFIRGPLRRRRRRRRGQCATCGYDLTGNVTGVCSECGQEMGR